MKKKVLSTVIAAMMIVALGACGAETETAETPKEEAAESGSEEAEASGETYDEITIRTGNMYNDTTTQGRALEKFKEDIEAASNGSIKVDIYHGGSLGSEKDHIQAQKEGSIELVFSGTAGIGLYVPETAVFECWYAFETMDQIAEVVGKLEADLDAACQAQGFKLLGSYFDGPRQILTNKKITSLEDLEGVKLRAPGANIYVDSISALGAQSISMPLGDVYTSLQTGAIDAMEGTVDLIVQQKFYEQAKYLTQDAHVFQPLFITYNLEAWEQLSESTQSLIAEKIEECAIYQQEIYATALEEELATLEDAGVEFCELTDRDQWIEAVEAASSAYAAENGELGQKIYDEIKALREK